MRGVGLGTFLVLLVLVLFEEVVDGGVEIAEIGVEGVHLAEDGVDVIVVEGVLGEDGGVGGDGADEGDACGSAEVGADRAGGGGEEARRRVARVSGGARDGRATTRAGARAAAPGSASEALSVRLRVETRAMAKRLVGCMVAGGATDGWAGLIYGTFRDGRFQAVATRGARRSGDGALVRARVSR